MSLTALRIRGAQPAHRPYKLFDQKGLFLQINPSGSKLWRFKYSYVGREKLLSLGAFPEVSLADARKRHVEARSQLLSGIDPSELRRAERIKAESESASFEVVAKEYVAKHSPRWADSHTSKVTRRLERDIYPRLGSRPIGQITAPELLAVLQKIEARGAVETAHRAKQNCGQVFRYAIATGRAERDPSADLKGALAPPVRKHHPSVTDPKDISALLLAIKGYEGSEVSRLALQLAPLVFVRPGELRAAEWSEVDLQAKTWRIPASKMKMKRDHIIPLSGQSLEILEDLHDLTGSGRYLFPGARSRKRCMSENTLNGALRRLGYGTDEMTAHGFRSMASTRLNEMGWNGDAIERQLAHCEKDSIRAAYNYAEHLGLRREMMQAWADYLDGLSRGKPQ